VRRASDDETRQIGQTTRSEDDHRGSPLPAWCSRSRLWPFPELSANISLILRPRLRVSRAAGNPAVSLSQTEAEGIRPPPS
jgi:hypothetical protein